jgi:carbon-monoxide dehydrogenase medium subunit
MIPAKFEYHAPSTLRQAVMTLRSYGGEARVLAGGMSLVPMMKLRLANLEAVVDLGRIEGLAGIDHTAGGGLVIGPMTTHYQIESSDVVQRVAPVLAEAASRVGDVHDRRLCRARGPGCRFGGCCLGFRGDIQHRRRPTKANRTR